MSHEEIVISEREHVKAFALVRTVADGQFSLKYNNNDNYYVMSLPANSRNSSYDWQSSIPEHGGIYVGEALSNYYLVYFKIAP